MELTPELQVALDAGEDLWNRALVWAQGLVLIWLEDLDTCCNVGMFRSRLWSRSRSRAGLWSWSMYSSRSWAWFSSMSRSRSLLMSRSRSRSRLWSGARSLLMSRSRSRSWSF